MQRVLVVGMSGSGKTTAARRVGAAYDLPFHEMDVLALGPGRRPPADLAQRVDALVSGDRWVIDSWGPVPLRPRMWAAADTVVWLDFPRRVVLPRLLRRSLRRSWTREPVFGGNVELWREWLSRDHPLWHAATTFGARRRLIGELLAGAPRARLVHLHDPDALERWLTGGGG